MHSWKVSGLILAALSILVLVLALAYNLTISPRPTERPAAIFPTLTVHPDSSPTAEPTSHPFTETPSPTEKVSTPQGIAKDYSTWEWHQDAHDPARTGYIDEEPAQPWRLLWTWNGPDAKGGPGEHFYDAPPEARSVAGDCCIYVPAGDQGLFALRKETGELVWHLGITAFNAAPAYDPDTGYVYAGGENGAIYKIDPRSGAIEREYHSGNSFNKALLIAEEHLFAVSSDGTLHKVDMEGMIASWTYSTSASASTPAAFSSKYGLIIFCTADLHVHAVDSRTGAARWVTNPRPFSSEEETYSYEGYWPVVADHSGIVFVRINLGMAALWSGPSEGNIYPEDNQSIRQFLIENPHLQNLYALRLEDGKPAFIPAVGYGGVEMSKGSSKELSGGPVPVVKRYKDGSEVAYSFFRSGQGDPPDGRWDSHIGEMILDNQTFPGLEAGDLRFIHFDNSYTHITDEQCPLSMAGDTIFHAHWGASEAARIIDRSSDTGFTYAAPILTQPHPVVIRRMQACHSYDPVGHWTSCDLTLYSDGRTWKGPGWWVYWNVLDPPTPPSQAYSGGHLPRYTYVSDGLVIISGNGGELMVFAHSSPLP
jgi:outer membrane protein assembly factor BamB